MVPGAVSPQDLRPLAREEVAGQRLKGPLRGRSRSGHSSFPSRRYHRAVRRLVQLALVVLGIRWFLRWRKRRHEARHHTELPPPAPAASDPADELRQKLAASRVEEEDAESPPAASVADRRAEVHDQGRAALDEMKSSDED
jgi:hypothetical protein